MSNPGLPTSRACGFVLSRPRAGSTEPEYLLLNSRRDGAPGFPKGHVDGHEIDLETAYRELKEETGLTDIEPDPHFVVEIAYRVKKGAQPLWKTVVYFRATLHSGEVRLSDEHIGFAWLTLPEALARISFDSLRDVLRKAAFHAKDPALFRMHAPDLAEADRHLASLPHADEALLAHLRGGASLARGFATDLAHAGLPIHVDATAVGTLLHDVGRALGRHADHQIVGVDHLRATPLAAYSFACITHFTKGASMAELIGVGIDPVTVDRFFAAQEIEVLTWEETCAALADSCMMGPKPAAPRERFADLRRRYGPGPLIDLQEARYRILLDTVTAATGRDPVAAAGFDSRVGG